MHEGAQLDSKQRLRSHFPHQLLQSTSQLLRLFTIEGDIFDAVEVGEFDGTSKLIEVTKSLLLPYFEFQEGECLSEWLEVKMILEVAEFYEAGMC